MSTKKIAVSTLWQIASQAVMAGLSAVSVKFVAMGLSKELAGSYNSAYGYLQLFAILADFGLYAVSVKEVSKTKDQSRVLGALLVLRVCITLLSLGGAVLVAWFVPAWQGTPLRLGITIASLVPFFTLLAGVLRTTFQISFKMHLVFIAEVLQRVLTASLMAWLIFAGVRGSSDPFIYQLFLWIGAIGAFLLFLISLFFSERILPVRPCFDRALLLRLLKTATPYGVAFLCIALYRQFDLTMIALLRPDFRTLNAEYGFAQRISEMTYLIPTFLLNSTLPVLSERRANGEHTASLLGKTLFLILLIGATASLFSFFWSRPLMELLTTSAYLSTALSPGADTALRFLSVPMFLNGLVLFSFYTLLTEHRWKPLVSTMLVAVVLSVVSNLFLIPAYGYVGAIVTSMIVHAFLVLTLFPRALAILPVSFSGRSFFTLAGFTFILGVALFLSRPFLLSELETVVACALGVLFLAGLAWVLRVQKIVRG
jgi:O-antigen/teichoic acid export membrane protein